MGLFGKSKRKQLLEEQLVNLLGRVDTVASATDAAAMQALEEEILHTVAQIGASDLSTQVWQAVERLRERGSAARAQDDMQGLRPCPSCDGREFRPSEELQIREVGITGKGMIVRSPTFRLVVCVGCGRTEWLVPNPDGLAGHPGFGPVMRVSDGGGPFR